MCALRLVAHLLEVASESCLAGGCAQRVKAGVGSRCTAADYALVARRRAHEERRRLKAEAKKQAQVRATQMVNVPVPESSWRVS